MIDLMENITSTVKLIADDISLFSVVNNPNIFANQLNKDLELIAEWAYKGKIYFSPDKNKQVQEVIFSRDNLN